MSDNLPSPEQVAVTQADRDAAAKLLGYGDWADATDYRLTGAQDRQVERTVQAFALHRITAINTQKVGDDVVERVARALSIPQHHTGWDLLTEQEKSLFYMQADYALKAIAQSQSSIRMREALIQARAVFYEYADLHHAKGTADGDAKADRNLAHAERITEALGCPTTTER